MEYNGEITEEQCDYLYKNTFINKRRRKP